MIIDGAGRQAAAARGSRSPPPSRTSGAPPGAPQLKLKPSDTVLFVIDVLSVQPKDVLERPEGQDGRRAGRRPDGRRRAAARSPASTSPRPPRRPPTKLEVIPLVEGDGPVAKAGRLVTFNYYGAVWGSKKPFDSSFSRGAPVPVRRRRQGPDPGLGQGDPAVSSSGSRVLIIAPPGDAYGARRPAGIPANSTLTFVVDVLGVDS